MPATTEPEPPPVSTRSEVSDGALAAAAKLANFGRDIRLGAASACVEPVSCSVVEGGIETLFVCACRPVALGVSC